jgi:hypothetical protein
VPKITFWYSVDGETRYEMTIDSLTDRSDRAVEAGEDYHHNHDGWEDSWPVEIELFDSEDGPCVGLFEVEREAIPSFSARELPSAS